ncbi:lamin tail domain-containing protein [Kineosporia succinea]|uniref:Endonuclease YncB(Thermonuclease family) n=1 Tax=Kineosporia succinea TaxID=84632 RepID=A0ABT9P9Z4_9ACTN|nr:lamin tail domain-containing protein [Kineosporia succinea]MDP9829521.1 endonuclease YncB(thermonuclease family) [Kineosporia succinea]
MAHRRPRTRLSASLVMLVGLFVTVTPSATGATAAAAGVTEYGTVAFVADGDTVDVAIDGVPADTGREGTRVRLLGIQAMELYEYHHDVSLDTGECHAVEATARLRSLLTTDDGLGRRVRLTARESGSSNLGRRARFVAVEGPDGRWRDVGATLLAEGQVLPSFQKTEYTFNRAYRKAAQTAAARGLGLWDNDFCGRGPAADLSVRVRWDAPGDDSKNVNGEYVRVTNHGTRTVDLSGWWVRDSATRPAATKAAARRGYIFPGGARVGPGKSVYVHVGHRPSGARPGHYYYGRSAPIFENVTGAPSHLGDGAYLFDPRGNLREWQQYPCVVRAASACST